MLKYGRTNWRVAGVRASIYYDAARRHLAAWFEGEECDPDDGVPHLGAALACLAILVDADAAGKLTDDRMVAGGYREYMAKLAAEVPRLKELHKDKVPFKHYVKGDEATVEPAPAPSDWRIHTEFRRPLLLSSFSRVTVRLGNGTEHTAQASDFSWGGGASNDYDITHWKYAE